MCVREHRLLHSTDTKKGKHITERHIILMKEDDESLEKEKKSKGKNDNNEECLVSVPAQK